MSQSSSYTAGTVVRFLTSKPFTDFAGVPVNPDYVYLKFSVQGQTEVTYEWINPTGDVTNTIVQGTSGTGYFQADLPTTGLEGTWVWGWSSVAGSGVDVTGTEVVWVGEVIISPDPL